MGKRLRNYRALIDGDIVAHRVAWTTVNDDFAIAKYRVDEMMHGIVSDTRAKSAVTFLSDSEGNFRKEIFPEYKANRKKEKPLWLDDLKQYLVDEYKAVWTTGQEADDALGIEQDKYDDPAKCRTIICSIDKDLLQIPGHHYNFVYSMGMFVTKEEGMLHFYTQLLMGDNIDNIRGIPGVGIAKAKTIIEGVRRSFRGGICELPKLTSKLLLECHSAYSKHYGKAAEEQMLLWGQLLKIRQEEGEIWSFPTFPELKLSLEEMSSSTQTMQAESTQSTEPISLEK